MFSLCKPVSSKKRFLPFRKINEHYSFTLFDSAANLLSADWQNMAEGNIFLHKEYLKIVEQGKHTHLSCRYVIVYYNEKPCGIIYFQINDFKAGVFGDLMNQQVENIRTAKMNLFGKYLESNRDEILLRLCTCGNNLISGAHGFVFDPKMKAGTAHELLVEITDLIAREEKLRGTISAILLKDFVKPLQPAYLFEEEGYSRFFVEPNMVVEIPADVNSVEEYVSLFSKKYRNRARSIFKDCAEAEVRELPVQEMHLHQARIYELYEAIFEKAKFKLIKLPPHYFEEVKKTFPDRFTVKGFFAGGNLVAFASSFLLEDGSLEAHYIGFDYALNNEMSLYQNILYSMISEAIRHKCKRVNLGRTASEIKTTVGAKPEDLICYIKPQNTISRLIQKPFISFLQPQPWIPRNPFKEEASIPASSFKI
jgi:hypothetical protein